MQSIAHSSDNVNATRCRKNGPSTGSGYSQSRNLNPNLESDPSDVWANGSKKAAQLYGHLMCNPLRTGDVDAILISSNPQPVR